MSESGCTNLDCCRYPCNGTTCSCIDTICYEGEGPCSMDSQCTGTLVCGKNNCPWDSSKDCCRKPCDGNDSACICADTLCYEGEGPCALHQECEGALTCGVDNCLWGDGTSECCRKPCNAQHGGHIGECCSDTVCHEGEGDCDVDDECDGYLVCGTNNCPWGVATDDCCRKPRDGSDVTLTCTDTICYEGEGPCSDDSQCRGTLVCGPGTCSWDDSKDCCRKPCDGSADACDCAVTMCKEEEGPCSNDSQCSAALVCLKNNCPWDSSKDCCEG